MKFLAPLVPRQVSFDYPSGTSGTTAFRRYENVAGFGTSGNPSTGAIVFELPIGFANHMQTHEIVGYTYGSGQGMFDLWVSFYSYATGPAVVNPAVSYADGYLRPQVRIGRRISTGNPVIILGDITTTWTYPKVQLASSMMATASSTDALLDGTKATLETVLTDFDTLTAPLNTSSGGPGSNYDGTLVHLAGTETISGAKTFSVAPAVPDSSFAIAKITGLQSALDAKAADAAVVHTATVETISGAKTFTAATTLQNSAGTQALLIKARTTANGGQSTNLLEFTDAGGNVFTTFSANGTLVSLLTATLAVVEAGNSLGTAGEVRTMPSASATSTTTTLPSGTVKFRTRYWNGTASVDDDIILQATRRSVTAGDMYLSISDDVEVTGYLNASTDLRVAGASISRGTPSGAAGYVPITATSTTNATTTITDVAGLALTMTAVANRRYRLRVMAQISSSVAGDQGAIYLREGSTTLNGVNSSTLTVASRGYGIYCEVVLTPTAGSHTYKVSIQRASGTGNINLVAGVTTPCYIAIEDMGPI